MPWKQRSTERPDWQDGCLGSDRRASQKVSQRQGQTSSTDRRRQSCYVDEIAQWTKTTVWQKKLATESVKARISMASAARKTDETHWSTERSWINLLCYVQLKIMEEILLSGTSLTAYVELPCDRTVIRFGIIIPASTVDWSMRNFIHISIVKCIFIYYHKYFVYKFMVATWITIFNWARSGSPQKCFAFV